MLRCAPAGSEPGTGDSMCLLTFAVHVDISRATSAFCSVNYKYGYGMVGNGARPRHAGHAYKLILPGMEAYWHLLAAIAYEQLLSDSL